MMKIYGKGLKGNSLRRMNTLVYMVSGVLGNSSVRLPEMASSVHKQVKTESRIKHFKRFLLSKFTNYEACYLPFIAPLLAKMGHRGELVFVIDGSTCGKGCMVLMISLVYKKRAIPIIWLTKKAKKGHLPEEMHCQLIECLMKIVPSGCRKLLLGDGEFDGIGLQKLLDDSGWQYVLRTRKDLLATEDRDVFRLRTVGTGQQEHFFIPDLKITQQGYGPVNLLIWHGKKYKDALYLLSNMDFAQQISNYYKKRFTIETLFSDHKTKGFQLHRSKIGDPKRLANLLIAACLAYIFLMLVALQGQVKHLTQQVHRRKRCDLSLFTLGKRLLEYMIDQRIWYVLSYNLFIQKSVR